MFPVTCNLFPKLVGTARFELATPCTPSKCATRLRHVPILQSRVTSDKWRAGAASLPLVTYHPSLSF